MSYGPLPGNYLFESLHDCKSIVLAVNPRITHGVVRGIFRAALALDAPVIMELAKSESDLKGGYTGLTPAEFSKRVHAEAEAVGHDVWALHADHITVKKGTPDELEEIKRLIDAQIKANFTSFTIDASFLFNYQGKTVEEELRENIRVTTELAEYIEEKMEGPYGLEVEVGEIGKKDEHGRVLTKPEEAVGYIKALNKNGVFPQVLAIANGSTHGNIFDDAGRPIPQVSIDTKQTLLVVKALSDAKLKVKISQHGITGTPLSLINSQFPKGDIIKGNVGTFWMDLFYEVLEIFDLELYQDIYDWTLETYREEAKKKGVKTDVQLFGTYGKFAIGARHKDGPDAGKFIFFDRLYGIPHDVELIVEEKSHAEAMCFLKAFNAPGMASVVRDYMKKKG